MRKTLISLGACAAMLLSTAILTAQPDIRDDDHFWRRRVVNRVSLVEKINQPLVRHESNYYSGNGRYSQTDGMVQALIEGVKQGKYVAYHPEDWNHQMSFEALKNRMIEFEGALAPASDGWDDEYSDEFSQQEQSLDDGWNDEETQWDVADANEWGSPFEEQPGGFNQAPARGDEMPDLAPYEEIMHVVEDYIFDKNTSSMQQRIDFFEVIWVDPSGALPEKVLARFMWEDVRDQLDETMWKSRFNDAEARSVAEVFELRIFHAFPIEVGGHPVTTLMEAEARRQEMIQFEAQLWSY